MEILSCGGYHSPQKGGEQATIAIEEVIKRPNMPKGAERINATRNRQREGCRHHMGSDFAFG